MRTMDVSKGLIDPLGENGMRWLSSRPFPRNLALDSLQLGEAVGEDDGEVALREALKVLDEHRL